MNYPSSFSGVPPHPPGGGEKTGELVSLGAEKEKDWSQLPILPRGDGNFSQPKDTQVTRPVTAAVGFCVG